MWVQQIRSWWKSWTVLHRSLDSLRRTTCNSLCNFLVDIFQWKKITLSIKDLILEFLLHLQHIAKYTNMNLPIISRSLGKFPWEVTLQQQCLECFCLPTCKAARTVLCDYMPVMPWPSQLGAQLNMEKRQRLGSIMLYVMVSNDCDILCMICKWVKKKGFFLIVQYLASTAILRFW